MSRPTKITDTSSGRVKRALIVASGLHDIVGHEHTYTLAVAEALRRKGIRVSIFGRADATREVMESEGFVPLFRPFQKPKIAGRR